jgi:hypothetical protein
MRHADTVDLDHEEEGIMGNSGTGLEMNDKALAPAPAVDLAKACGGSEDRLFNSKILRDVMACLPKPRHAMTEEESIEYSISIASSALEAFKPTDAIEGMLASQAVTLHLAATECLRRSMLHEQPFEVSSKLRRDAANLMRAMTEMLEALDRKRGKGPQVVRVERVVVHEGGQAIVGNITPGAGPAPVGEC